MLCKEPEILFAGPAGTGKSRACLEKLHLCAQKYAGMRGLIVRRTRKSLTQTAIKTFEQQVVTKGSCRFNSSTQSYLYPNGSELVVAGLDKPEKIMSAEYDMAYLQEATETKTVDPWEMITTRLRNGVMPYQQLIADCNPDAPTHYLKQRCDRGATKMILSQHKHNPVLFDQETGELTPFGVNYMAKLDALTGVRKDRLRDGKWVAAEGIIYEGFNAGVHVVPAFVVPRGWTRYWCLDFGYKNPFVWQDWAESPDGVLYLTKEIYHTEKLVQDLCVEIAAAVGATFIKEGQVIWTDAEPKPRKVICDHDMEDRMTFERWMGLRTDAAKKEVNPGIQDCQLRLRRQAPKNEPRVFFFEDALVEIDESLMERSKPYSTIQEFDTYVWDESNGRKKGDQPLKEDDHGMDCFRYMVHELDAKARITPEARPADLERASTWSSKSPMYRAFDDDGEDYSSRKQSLFKVGR